MHKFFPKIFVFLDKYDSQIFKNNNINIGIIYRNYNDHKKEVELKKIAVACKKKRYPLFVSNNIKLALKFKADGIYIPAFNKLKRFLNFEKRNLLILGSAHNQKEIKQKIAQKCKIIFLSPTFCVKKSRDFLDIHRFNNLSNLNSINFCALGGINEQNIKKLKLISVKGFGGISIFEKKNIFKRSIFAEKLPY